MRRICLVHLRKAPKVPRFGVIICVLLGVALYGAHWEREISLSLCPFCGHSIEDIKQYMAKLHVLYCFREAYGVPPI